MINISNEGDFIPGQEIKGINQHFYQDLTIFGVF